MKKGIDSHQHFWQYDAVRESWITDEMSKIRRDFLPADLAPVLYANGMEGSVVVQSDQSEEHNEWLLQLAKENNIIKGIVGWVDLQAANVEERLTHYSQLPMMKGFRHVLQGETDRALMLKPAFMNGIASLQKFDFTYDILIFPDQLQYIPKFVGAFPNQKFVIDHIAKPYIKDKKIVEWKKALEAVAAFDNVYCKVSGMVTEADYHHWKNADFTPYLDVVTNAFGTHRIMYGSDWPVCMVAGAYEQVIGIVREYYSSYSESEQLRIFRENAIEFYQLKL